MKRQQWQWLPPDQRKRVWDNTLWLSSMCTQWKVPWQAKMVVLQQMVEASNMKAVIRSLVVCIQIIWEKILNILHPKFFLIGHDDFEGGATTKEGQSNSRPFARQVQNKLFESDQGENWWESCAFMSRSFPSVNITLLGNYFPHHNSESDHILLEISFLRFIQVRLSPTIISARLGNISYRKSLFFLTLLHTDIRRALTVLAMPRISSPLE